MPTRDSSHSTLTRFKGGGETFRERGSHRTTPIGRTSINHRCQKDRDERKKEEKTSVTCSCRRNPCACLFSCDTLAFVYETLWTPFTFNPCYYLISEMNDGILLLNYGLCGSDACVLRSLVVSDHVRIRFPVEVTLEDVTHGRNMSEIVKQYNTIVCNSYDYNNTIRKEYLLAYYT